MKNKLPLFLLTALLTMILTACTIQIGFSDGGTSATTSSDRDDDPPSRTSSSATTALSPTETTPGTSESERNPDSTTAPVTTPTPTKPVTESTHPYKDETIVVKNPATPVSDGKTYTGLPPQADVTYTVIDPLNKLGLPTDKFSHSFGVAKDGKPHNITVNNQKRFDDYKLNAMTWDNKTEGKILYLTFDCGYEYQNLTADILDTLKEKKVSAAFFCTLDYLKKSPTITARMIAEGHIVGNHSATHPSDCSTLSRERMAWEVLGVHNYLLKNFGYESRYFRFPAGVYSESMLEVVQSVGYRSSFWSIAYADWDPANQPSIKTSFDTLTSRLHPGAVILLHSVSTNNAAILGDFIDYARSQGYEFRSLDDYEYWDS